MSERQATNATCRAQQSGAKGMDYCGLLKGHDGVHDGRWYRWAQLNVKTWQPPKHPKKPQR